jgi:hypothetical protein
MGDVFLGRLSVKLQYRNKTVVESVLLDQNPGPMGEVLLNGIMGV